MNRKTLLLPLLTALFLSFPLQVLAAIDRVEPPFWWIGFEHRELQLMVHGDDIAGTMPSIDYPGVTVRRVVRVESPNYLFLYLDIAPGTAPGEFDIRFLGTGPEQVHRYRLEAKSDDPEHARGFDSSDAIYLITPDRFANGNPANDSIEGMADTVDRSDKDGRHGGDIKGIRDRLQYIQDMGFTAIWLNPVLENDVPAVSYHGYGATDFYRVDARYGSNKEYRDLVKTARSMGIGTIMDMIVNHTGETHWWMDDLPTHDWINMPHDPQVTSHQRYVNQDPHASDHDRRAYSDGWFVVPGMPDLNQRNPLLADYLTQNALWWIEYLGLAGIRMDTYPYPDKHYMAEWTRRVMLEYPEFNIVGEEWSGNPATVAYWQRGQSNLDGYESWLPTLMDFPLQEALRLALTTEDGEALDDFAPGGLERLYRMLSYDFLYPDPDALVIFPDNHDMSRIYTQVGHDDALYRMALAYVLTMRGTPQIYYGTEILMHNRGDESHGNIRSDFPGGWPGDRSNAFTGEGLGRHEREAQAFVRSLLTWRRNTPVIHHGRTMHFVPQDATYVYFRYDDRDAVMVALNKNDTAHELELDRFAERLDGYHEALDVLTSAVYPLDRPLRLPPRSVLVLELR